MSLLASSFCRLSPTQTRLLQRMPQEKTLKSPMMTADVQDITTWQRMYDVKLTLKAAAAASWLLSHTHCNQYTVSALTLLVGHQQEHPACKNRETRRYWRGYLTSAVQMIYIWSSWCHCHPITSCFTRTQIGLTLLVLAYPGCPGKGAVKRVSNQHWHPHVHPVKVHRFQVQVHSKSAFTMQTYMKWLVVHWHNYRYKEFTHIYCTLFILCQNSQKLILCLTLSTAHCYIFVLSFLAKVHMHCPRLTSNIKDLLTYLYAIIQISQSYAVSQKTSHLWLVIILTRMIQLWQFLAEVLLRK